MNENGHYDAQIVRDSVYLDTTATGRKPGYDCRAWMCEEGPRYHIRDIDWEGNTVYTDEFLSASLGFLEVGMCITAPSWRKTCTQTSVAAMYLASI